MFEFRFWRLFQWGRRPLIVLGLGPAFAHGAAPAVRTGLDVVEGEDFAPLRGHRLAVVTNPTAVDAQGRHLIDLLTGRTDVELAALYGPEHGLRGNAPAGRKIADAVSASIPVYSLYGDRRKPTAEQGERFDWVVYDIQDVGARFYTYIWTLFQVEQFCAETGKKLIVLDRPNPLGGETIEGPTVGEGFESFVGMKPIPIRYGLTPGELAILFNEQGWLGPGLKADVEVIRLQGWRRDMGFEETGLSWTPPSPNMPTPETAMAYPGMCLLEGTGWSEGRGTARPFLNVGGAGVDSEALAGELNGLGLPGCEFLPAAFTPKAIEGADDNPKFLGRECGGLLLRIVDRRSFRPVKTGLAVVMALHRGYPSLHHWRTGGFDRLAGTDAVRKRIEAGESLDAIVDSWTDSLREFDRIRKSVMLY